MDPTLTLLVATGLPRDVVSLLADYCVPWVCRVVHERRDIRACLQASTIMTDFDAAWLEIDAVLRITGQVGKRVVLTVYFDSESASRIDASLLHEFTTGLETRTVLEYESEYWS